MLDSSFLQASEAAALAWDVPALAVGISVGDEVETVAVGCAPDARFHIASITKPFTAALVLELLDVESATGVWEPDVRVRHLLSHTSGYDCELTAVEQDAYQVRNQSNQDPLNFPIRTNNRLASLLRVVETGEGRPLGNVGPIFNDLKAELKAETDRLQRALTTYVPKFNELARRLGIEPISER